MDSYDVHFLDSNVIIGYILSWENNSTKCGSYFKREIDKNSSHRVYKECEDVFNRIRGWTLQFIRQLHDKYSMSSFINPNKELKEFGESFVRNICTYDPDYCEKVGSIINGLINDCREPLVNIMKNPYYYNDFKRKVVLTFKDAIKSLKKIFSNEVSVYKHCPETYDDLADIEGKLEDFGIHRNDRRILLDSHYFRTFEVRSDIAFITFDNGILNNKSDIELLLSGMHIFSPH